MNKPHFRSDLGRVFDGVSGPSLRGHIANIHFKPTVLAMVGVPVFDMQVAKCNGFDLNWVFRKGMQKLNMADSDLKTYLDNDLAVMRGQGNYLDFGTREYRERIAKTFHLMDRMGLADIDWAKVTAHMPEGADIFYRPEQCDTRETDFYSRVGYLGPFGDLEEMPELHNLRA